MSLWKRLSESRKKGKIKFYIHGGPVEGARFIDFREMEDEAIEAIREYSSKPLGEISRELEMRVCDAILKYLLMNFGNFENCGELAISRNLGIPRSRLRRLLAYMEWNDIIERIDIGKASPYIVRNVSKAMKEGFLNLTESEAEKLVKIIHSMGLAAPYRDPKTLLIEAIQSTLPNPEVFTEASVRLFKLLERLAVSAEQVHRPFNPGAVTTYYKGLHDFHLVQRYLTWPFQGTIVRDLLLELNVPDKVTDKDIKNGLRRLGEKYLRLTELSIQPLYDEIVKFGYEKAKRRIEKGLLRDRLLKTTDDVPRADVYWDKRLLKKYRILPSYGLVTLQTEELSPSHVRLAANILLAACRFAELVGVNPERIKECVHKAQVLIQSVKDFS